MISTHVTFVFESKLKTQCEKCDMFSNMENEHNVIQTNTKSLLLTNMPFSGAATTYHSYRGEPTIISLLVAATP